LKLALAWAANLAQHDVARVTFQFPASNMALNPMDSEPVSASPLPPCTIASML